MFTKLAVSLSKTVRFSIRKHHWKAENKTYELSKPWGVLITGPGGFMGYGDLFSPGSFMINPCLDLWGFMGKIRVI